MCLHSPAKNIQPIRSKNILSIMFGTATLKARLQYAVGVRVMIWSRGLCEESSDTEEPVNWS